jgi:DNA-binding transcriptional LysR family regulator
MIVMRPTHPLAEKSGVSLTEVAKYPWVFFNRHVHPPLHDLILRRLEAEHHQVNLVHHISQADQVTALLTDNRLLAWLTPAGAERVVRSGLVRVPLLDESIRLETRLVALANNNSPLVSEYVRSFMMRIEDQKPSEQLQLPIGGVVRLE